MYAQIPALVNSLYATKVDRFINICYHPAMSLGTVNYIETDAFWRVSQTFTWNTKMKIRSNKRCLGCIYSFCYHSRIYEDNGALKLS